MSTPCTHCGKKQFVALSATALSILALGASSALAVGQSGEQKDMRRVGHVDLQGRAAYHPDVINYPDGRVIAFVGTHSGASGADGPKPNPLLPGSPVQDNGTMIIDMTNPLNPVEKFHIPGAGPRAQSQSNRMCLGSDLPGRRRGPCLPDAQRADGQCRLVRIRGLGRHQRFGTRICVGDTQPSQHAQALVGVQDRHRLPAR